tara:strand:+ start:1809 stop:2048 length:240 start_codon:yes stop_codon:yes gene_type:complete
MIKIYGAKWCGPCNAAKKLLDSLGKSYEVIDIEDNNYTREMLMEKTGGHTIPQIVINDKCIGGFDNLRALINEGQLEEA